MGQSDKSGFSFQDEWRGEKRSLDDTNDDHVRDAAEDYEPVKSMPPGLIFHDAPLQKRDLFAGIDPGLLNAPDPTAPQSEGRPNGWIFANAPQKRDEGSNPLPPESIKSPAQSLTFKDAPIKRDESFWSGVKEVVKGFLS